MKFQKGYRTKQAAWSQSDNLKAGKAQHSVKAEHIWGRDCASNITEGTSSYSVSQFCNVRGDLQTVIEMLKNNGNTGYNSLYSAERDHSFKLASLGTNNSISRGAQSCCDLENLWKNLMKYSAILCRILGCYSYLWLNWCCFSLATLKLDTKTLYSLWGWSDHICSTGISLSYLPLVFGKLTYRMSLIFTLLYLFINQLCSFSKGLLEDTLHSLALNTALFWLNLQRTIAWYFLNGWQFKVGVWLLWKTFLSL